LGEVERLGKQNRLLAAPALRLIADPVSGDAIEAVAVRAGDQQSVGHGGYRKEGLITGKWRLGRVLSS
jgi:hypothetical protein